MLAEVRECHRKLDDPLPRKHFKELAESTVMGPRGTDRALDPCRVCPRRSDKITAAGSESIIDDGPVNDRDVPEGLLHVEVYHQVVTLGLGGAPFQRRSGASILHRKRLLSLDVGFVSAPRKVPA